MKNIKYLTARVLLALTVSAVAAPAFAADPTYSSQIGSALQAVNMSTLTTDVGSFAAMGFSLLLTTAGVLFAASLLRKFLK